MKRILAASLAALLAVGIIGCSKADENENDNGADTAAVEDKVEYDGYEFTYAVNESGDYEITKLVYTGADSISVTVPEKIDERPVTGIAAAAFKACTYMSSITISDTVEYIGDNAFFGCTALTEIEIPDSVASIGEGVFRNCTALKTVTLPNTLKAISAYTFWGCEKIEEITLPDTLVSIGDGAFFNCKALKSVSVPAKVTSIGQAAFLYCDALESVTLNSTDVKLADWSLGSHDSTAILKGKEYADKDEGVKSTLAEYVKEHGIKDAYVSYTDR